MVTKLYIILKPTKKDFVLLKNNRDIFFDQLTDMKKIRIDQYIASYGLYIP